MRRNNPMPIASGLLRILALGVLRFLFFAGRVPPIASNLTTILLVQ